MIIFGQDVAESHEIIELEGRIKYNLFLLQDLSRKGYNEIHERYVMLVKMLEEDV